MNHLIQHPKGQIDFFVGENKRRKWGLQIPETPDSAKLEPNQSWLLSIYLGKNGEDSDVFLTIKELWDCMIVPNKIRKRIDMDVSARIESGDFKKHARQFVGMRWVIYDNESHLVTIPGEVPRHLNHSEALSLAIFSKNLFQNEHRDWMLDVKGFLKKDMLSIVKNGKNVTLSIINIT